MFFMLFLGIQSHNSVFLCQEFGGAVDAVRFGQFQPHQSGDGRPHVLHLHGGDLRAFPDTPAGRREQAVAAPWRVQPIVSPSIAIAHSTSAIRANQLSAKVRHSAPSRVRP